MCVVGLRIKETKEVYEGEVIELTPVETENPMGGKYHHRCLHLLVNFRYHRFIAHISGQQIGTTVYSKV